MRLRAIHCLIPTLADPGHDNLLSQRTPTPTMNINNQNGEWFHRSQLRVGHTMCLPVLPVRSLADLARENSLSSHKMPSIIFYTSLSANSAVQLFFWQQRLQIWRNKHGCSG